MSAIQAPSKTIVRVTYNGTVKEFKYNEHETVQALLSQATAAFQIVTDVHRLSLYNQAGSELQDTVSLAAAGVKAGDLLVLRQSVVKGVVR